MLSLLSCSAPRIDEYDPYAPPPRSPPRRRVSRSLSLMKPPSKKRISKLSIGTPEAFRHEFHLGKEIISTDGRPDLWDSARWQQEIESHEKSQTRRTATPVSPIPPVSPAPFTPTTPRLAKRNSITPQKRKPVPSILLDIPTISPFATLSPHNIPLPPSPTVERTESPAPKPLVPLLDSPRRGPSTEDSEKLYVTQTVKVRWDNAMGEIERALKDGEDRT